MTNRKTKGTPDEIDVYVGGRLRELRRNRGVSQEKLGKALGMTFQQIQKYEKGTNRISAGNLFKIAGFLEVSVLAFYPGYDPDRRFPGDGKTC